jgi:hypothetical protein
LLASVAATPRQEGRRVANATETALAGLKRRDLIRFLETDRRVREWLASGALMSTQEVAEYVGVERPRIWRWEKAGRIERVAETGATPLFLRVDVEPLREEHQKLQADRADRDGDSG